MSVHRFIESIDKNDYLFFPQSYFIQNGSTEDKKVSFIGRYENFINDVNFILDKVESNENIPHLNRNPIYDKHPELNQHNFYKHLYIDKDVKNWVRERYSNDFKIFNYDMDI